MSRPKILIGCPTSDHKAYCWDEYVSGVKALTYENKYVLIVDNSESDEYFEKIKADLPAIKDEYLEFAKDRIVHSRNLLRKKVLEEGYDYLLSLEQDVVAPPDLIERLLKYDKKIISAVYYNFQPTKDGKLGIAALLYKKVGENDDGEAILQPYVPGDIFGKGLVKVDASGLGVVLIHRDVLEKVEFRHVKGKQPFDDMWFCIDAKKAGFEIFADSNILCEHHVKKRAWHGIK